MQFILAIVLLPPAPANYVYGGLQDIVSKQFEANGRLKIYGVKDGKWHDAEIETNENRSFIPF